MDIYIYMISIILNQLFMLVPEIDASTERT